MALGAMRLFNADYAVAVTGVVRDTCVAALPLLQLICSSDGDRRER